MPKAVKRLAYVHRLEYGDPLERVEAALPLTRDVLIHAWEELSPSIRRLAPERHRAIQQAFALEDLPLEVLTSYFLREAQRALEALPPKRIAR